MMYLNIKATPAFFLTVLVGLGAFAAPAVYSSNDLASAAHPPVNKLGGPMMVAGGFGDFFDAFKGDLSRMGSNVADVVTGNGERSSGGQVTGQSQSVSSPSNVSMNHSLSREENREIQQRLADLGYAPGPADGLPGKNTRSAIYAFQRDNGMSADGQPSMQVLSSLRSKTGNRSAHYASRPEPVNVVLGENLRARERQIYYECAEQLNAERRREGIPEIQLKRQGEMLGGVTNKDMTTAALGVMEQYGMSMLSSPEARMASHLGRAASAQNARAQSIQKSQRQQAAVLELQGCVARKQRPAGYQY